MRDLGNGLIALNRQDLERLRGRRGIRPAPARRQSAVATGTRTRPPGILDNLADALEFAALVERSFGPATNKSRRRR